LICLKISFTQPNICESQESAESESRFRGIWVEPTDSEPRFRGFHRFKISKITLIRLRLRDNTILVLNPAQIL
jgi:hypothetical protein